MNSSPPKRAGGAGDDRPRLVRGPGAALRGGGDVLARAARCGAGAAMALQEAVAGLVAQRVVDDLEAVEVQEQDRVVVARVRLRPLQRLLDAVQERRPVGQAGQPIGQRGPPQVVGHPPREGVGPAREPHLAVLEHREQARQHDADDAGEPDVTGGPGQEAVRGGGLDRPPPAGDVERDPRAQRRVPAAPRVSCRVAPVEERIRKSSSPSTSSSRRPSKSASRSRRMNTQPRLRARTRSA